MAQGWFERFQFGNFLVWKIDWKSRWNHNEHISSKELNINYKTVLNNLKKAGYKKKTRCL